jgi:hypothetical protein
MTPEEDEVSKMSEEPVKGARKGRSKDSNRESREGSNGTKVTTV